MGHIGWTPQAQHGWAARSGSRARRATQARALLADAIAIQEAGAFSIVLELVPEQLAAAITSRLRIPTIGIGAGPHCSGQVQVITGPARAGRLHAEARPRLRRPPGDDRRRGEAYMADVAAGTFPGPAETVRMDDAVLDEVLGRGALGPPARRRAPAGAGSRSTATSSRPRRAVMQVVRTRAELRAALRHARRDPSASCRRWAGCTTGHASLIAARPRRTTRRRS